MTRGLEEYKIGGRIETIQTKALQNRPGYWEEFWRPEETCFHSDSCERQPLTLVWKSHEEFYDNITFLPQLYYFKFFCAIQIIFTVTWFHVFQLNTNNFQPYPYDVDCTQTGTITPVQIWPGINDWSWFSRTDKITVVLRTPTFRKRYYPYVGDEVSVF